jgi:hypothetical protein
MSAFRRRTQFAAPFIVSIAACSGGKPHEDPAKTFPGTVWYVHKQAGDTCIASLTDLGCPKGAMCNPPPPSESKCPPFAGGQEWTNVAKRADGKCAMLPAGCVEESCLGLVTDCPLEIGQKLPAQFTSVFQIFQRPDDKGCAATMNSDFSCPPNVACNPPPPVQMPCPPNITPDKQLRVGQLPDGTCVIAPDGCTGIDCAGEKIDCPKE